MILTDVLRKIYKKFILDPLAKETVENDKLENSTKLHKQKKKFNELEYSLQVSPNEFEIILNDTERF